MASIEGGSVRVVARIRDPLNDIEKPWILVSRPDPSASGWVKISFTSDRISSGGKQSYEVDECYEEGIGNEELFDKEVKPLISGLYEGQNCTVFAYGTRGSGKTYTLQGSKEEVGLVALTLESLFPRVVEEGKVIHFSAFEVCQDRIIDFLDSKRSEVTVFEDKGKIRLKGLSKVKVNSTEEFQKLYRKAANTRIQKAVEPPHRSHIGCMLHVVSPQTENSKNKLVGKINFIDLASYENSRRMSSDGFSLTETTRIKKSLNAVHGVLYALNANDRIPYRDSKLTRMLQDSLGGSSRILMVTCINLSFCQETLQTISLASRSCIAGFLANLNPSKRGLSANKTTGKAHPQIMKSASKLSIRPNLISPKVVKPMSASVSAKKHAVTHFSARKAAGAVAIQNKGRKLFVDTPINQGKSSKQKNASPVAATSMDSLAQSEVNNTQESPVAATSMDFSAQSEVNNTQESEAFVDVSSQLEEKSTVNANSETDSSQLVCEKEMSPVDVNSGSNSSEFLSEKALTSLEANSSHFLQAEDVKQDENNLAATPFAYKTPTRSYLIKDTDASAPLSARLRDLSNNLKSLCMSTEANLKMTKDSSRLCNQAIHENMKPATPIVNGNLESATPIFNEHLEPTTAIVQSGARTNEKLNKTNNASPWTGVKDSLVKESLRFLNSASKAELKELKGIGEKRATYILEMRDDSPEPFKELDDLKDIGLSEKQIKGLMKNVAGNLFA